MAYPKVAVAALIRRAAACAVLMSGALAGAAEPDEWGRKIYQGRSLVPAFLPGQNRELPPYAARCVSCHQETRSSNSVIGISPLAPRLDAALLTESRSRRRGPKSRYELVTFCELLRTGVDPVGVLIEQTMPRYEISDAQCQALWRYLTFDRPRTTIVSQR